jgi:leucyl-tRNA synthetase
MSTYDFQEIERKWLPVWQRMDPFRVDDDDDGDDGNDGDGGHRERRYLLDMFSYPSGDLHMGHAEAYALGDLLARYWVQRGHRVLHPVGFDAFGLPAENAAIRRGIHPAGWTYANIDTQAGSLRRYAVSVDWSRRLHTCDPDYYRWTQWLFLRCYQRGLAYRKSGWVNWCPRDRTVLANEQVVGGGCERCGTPVRRRELTQWFLRITAYAQRLLDDLTGLAGGWPERVLTMQRNWIGRRDGAYADFLIAGRAEPVRVFTTRPETLPRATFLAVAPEAPLAARICRPDRRDALAGYLARAGRHGGADRWRGRAGTGVFLGVHAINPATGQPVPVYAADYLTPDDGTGAVMGVPATDERDREFAAAHGLPVVGPAPDRDPESARQGTLAWLEATGRGGRAVTYRLRDWLISRQRYWGCPIPIVHCGSCGEVPVPEERLPVTLPDLPGSRPAPEDVSPLAAATGWVAVRCPRCDRPARRDTDTIDTFVDSSWYFLRYCSPRYDQGPFDPQAVRRWLPVDQYVGGAEHATGHLLFARFATKVLHDLGLVEVTEPFRRLMTQGQVINQGRAMSKSLGNGVELAGQLDAYGVDAVRVTMVFAGPPAEDIDWADVSPVGAQRFLRRAWWLAGAVASAPGGDPATGDVGLRRATHRAIAQVTAHIEERRLNLAVARLMELAGQVRRAVESGCGPVDPAVREATEALAVMLSTVAPYTAEEMWQRLGHEPTVARAGWPAVDPALVAVETVTCVVQVAGRVRDRLAVPPDIGEDELRRRALAAPAVRAALGDREVARVVVRPPGLVHVVPGPD